MKIMRIGQAIFIINALAWVLAGAAMLFRYRAAPPVPFWFVGLLSVGMLVYGGLLAVLAFYLPKRRRIVYMAAVAVMVLSIILPIFDDFGLADLLAVLPAVAALIVLIVYKEVFSPPN